MLFSGRACLNRQGKLLKELMDKTGVTIKELAERSYYSKSLISKFRSGERTMNPQVIEKFAEVFHMEYQDFDVDYYMQEQENIFCQEYNNCINQIVIKFRNSDYTIEYDLCHNFDIYTRMGNVAWNLLVGANLLDDFGKNKLRDSISILKTSIAEQVHTLDAVLPYLELIKEKEITQKIGGKTRESKSENTDKRKLEKQLLRKLKSASIEIAELFLVQMDSITTMDKDDWNLLIAYTLLGGGNFYMQSEQQEQILDLVDDMIQEKKHVKSVV